MRYQALTISGVASRYGYPAEEVRRCMQLPPSDPLHLRAETWHGADGRFLARTRVVWVEEWIERRADAIGQTETIETQPRPVQGGPLSTLTQTELQRRLGLR